jgi:predicted ATPase
MGELKLYGMKAAYDEIMATAVKRQHEPQRIVGDLLNAGINEKQARYIKYPLTIAKLPLAKDFNDLYFVIKGVEQMRTGIENWKNTDAVLHLPTWSAHLAEALLLANATDEAATVLKDALAVAHKNGDVFILAELHRLQGLLHVRLSRVAEAETEFLRAREVGSRQGAKLFELRAASDLAQLWFDQGYCEKAGNLLAPIFNSFTEGLDTPDLLQARHLLEQLSRH